MNTSLVNSDGIWLYNTDENGLLEYINRKEPFIACRICAGTLETAPWAQAQNRAEWIKASTV